MDKNKSVFKLKGLPNSYWLNLDADEHRRIYMEAQFKYWEVEKDFLSYPTDGPFVKAVSYTNLKQKTIYYL